MTLIALDLGTSFIKGAILDLDTYSVKNVRRTPFPAQLPNLPPLHFEYDPISVIGAVRQLLDELAPFAGACEGLVMCSQMHGLVFANDDGEPQSNIVGWQDQRVLHPYPSADVSVFNHMIAQLTDDDRRQLGNELFPGQPIGVLYERAARNALPREKWVAASLADFVLANICEATPVTEYTHAMSHGTLNLETMDWHWNVIDTLGLGETRWPDIGAHGDIVGTFALGTREIPCYTPVGDFQCALLGALVRPGDLSLNISTGAQVSALLPSRTSGNFQTRPYFDNHFVATITHLPGGRSINALIRLLSELTIAHGFDLQDPWTYIVREAERAQSPRMTIDLAFYHGALGSEGAITHIQEADLTVGSLFRSVFESMADGFWEQAQRLQTHASWDQIVFSGGLAHKIPLLRNLIVDRFETPHRMSPSPEDTLTGLMALGMAFTGRASSVHDATETIAKNLGARRETE